MSLPKNKSVTSKPKPAVSLTLIPPSPVTDKIMLDMRAAVRNEESSARTFEVSVFLNEEAPGIKFRWPTAGHAGDHAIIVVATCGNEIRRTARPMRIMSSPIRSTERIGGAWAGIYHWSEGEGLHWNADIKKMSEDQWRELVRGMHEIGMDIINIQELFRNEEYAGKQNIEKKGYKGLAFYPSKLLTGEEAADTLQALCDESGAHLWMNMEVFLFEDGGDTGSPLIPRPIEEVKSDLLRFPNFEKILCFQYPGLMTHPDASIKLGGQAAVKLYQDYRRYLELPRLF